MIKIIIAAIATLAIAIVMTMTRGVGIIYVPVLIATGTTMNQAATTGQLILVTTAIAVLLIFQKHKVVDWKLALVIDPPTNIMAFFGGFYAHTFSAVILKFIFAGLLIVASLFMLYSVREQTVSNKKRFGF